ncbi:hypothetical protein [Kitasatospora sp. GP82]|uniref:hypothetical protein n=1 Tax=Kitasatospora sp. GP82 TaxID=3035089 RepID=UPI0024753328|nr:hypothetical protein [Kitasatospora sp. GP82]MDH6129656.1 hypothetical protein [Kitasatospora sp. GP82]
MRTTRVFDLAYRLAVAARTRACVRLRPGGGYLVEAPLPAGLTEQEELAVLDVLADADRYGHDYSPTAERVWAELDEEREQQ